MQPVESALQISFAAKPMPRGACCKQDQLKAAVFLDRDGVINRKAPDGRYIARVEEFEFLPAVIDCVKRLNRAGLPVIVITNQRGVATGSITTLTDIHDWMLHQFAESGALVSAIYVCPHDYRDRC